MLHRARLLGADLVGADLYGADLGTADGLTQDEVNLTSGDERTILPRNTSQETLALESGLDRTCVSLLEG